MESIERYVPLGVVIFLIVIAGLFDLLGRRDGKAHETRIGVIFGRIITDAPSLLAIAVTGVVLVMSLTLAPIPDQLWEAFWFMMGFYFGGRTLVGPDEPVTPAASLPAVSPPTVFDSSATNEG